MLRSVIKGASVSFSLFNFQIKDYDKVEETSKTARDFYLERNDKETGKDRLYRMFSVDELGRVSSELNAVYQAGFLGAFCGAVYGGFLGSRSAYFDFLDNNQATAFKSHLDAKKKLQDKVTVNFAKGAFRWGWRLGLFSASYVGFSTMISVYNGKSSIWEYMGAGVLTGSLYKFNMGPKGMASGGLVGGAFGTVAGAISLLILRMTGKSMEEVRYWQYKWKVERHQIVNEALKSQTLNEKDVLLEHHNQRFGGENLQLDVIEKIEAATVQSTPTQETKAEIVKKESAEEKK